MKRLLIFMLVLGMASYVQAGLMPIELSIDGVYDGPGNVTEITISPCTYLVIDVQAPEGLDWGAYLIIDGVFPDSAGEWGDSLGPPYAELRDGYYYADEMYPKVLAGAGADYNLSRYEETDWGFGYEIGDNLFEGVNPGGTAFEFIFHCAALGDVTISLYNGGGDFETPDDRILIHQTPEPATIALLGLGSLALLRKRGK